MPDDARTLSDDFAETANRGAPAPLPPSLMLPGLPMALQIFFNEALFDRCRLIAKYLAGAQGFSPPHLIGKPEACFAVVSRSLTWKLDPYAVAQATYQTPAGQVGYFGALCQAILENSGQLVGGVKYRHFGEWSKVQRKFKIATSDKGRKYPTPNWPDEDEEGLGVVVSAEIRNEAEPRELEFHLTQAYPRNSTLWATDPMTQIKYTAVRRFATSVAPSLFMGVPFDREDWADSLIDVTPREPPPLRDAPTREDFGPNGAIGDGAKRRVPRQAAAAASDVSRETSAQPETPAPAQTGANGGQPEEKPYFFGDEQGEVHEFADWAEAVERYRDELARAGKGGAAAIEACWQNGAMLIARLRQDSSAKKDGAKAGEAADALSRQYGDLLDAADAARDAPQEPPPEAGNADADADVRVANDGKPQAWFPLARAKVRAMLDDGAPAADFRRFRAVNAEALSVLQRELRSWHIMLDKLIQQGEQQEAAG